MNMHYVRATYERVRVSACVFMDYATSTNDVEAINVYKFN